MREPAFVLAAQRATSDPTLHAQARQSAADLEALLAETLACDREQARTRLRATLVVIEREIGRLVAMSLLPGTTWADAAHRHLARRAQELFGDEAARVVPPAPEVLVTPPRGAGLFR
jgi:hypothetical protein